MHTNRNIKYLPYSGRRYLVGSNGTIYNKDGSVIPTVKSETGETVELVWLNGVMEYSVGMLVIVTFQPMYLPEHLWIEIEPLHRDDDPYNNSVDNLVYRFKNGLIEHDDLPGFFYIPGYTSYVIDRYGNMRNGLTLREKTWFQVKPDLIRNSKGGYWCTRVTNVPTVSGTLLRHRALCLTFKPIESADTYDMVVNHIDGVPGNDNLDNLEWSNYSKNNQHAHDNNLTGKKNHAILVKNLKTEEIVKFNNTKELAKYLGYQNTAPIRYRIRHAATTLFEDFLQFKFDDGLDWVKIDINVEPKKILIGSKMAARNVFTGEIKVFETYDQGSVLTGIDKQTIMIHLRDAQVVPFMGYNFGYYHENMSWPEHHEFNIRAYKLYPVRTPDPIIVNDLINNEVMFFESRNELASFLKISPSYATQLACGSETFKERYAIRYHSIRDNIKVPADWKVR